MDFRNVWACVPVYVDGMINGSILYFPDGPKLYEHRVETFEEHLADEYSMDLKRLKKRSGMIIGRDMFMPIPFSRKAVFIHFKHRHPEYKDDGAYGIVRVNVVQEIISEGKHAIIILKNGQKIYSLTSKKKLKEYLRNAKKVVKEMPHLEVDFEYYLIVFKEKFNKLIDRLICEWS